MAAQQPTFKAFDPPPGFKLRGASENQLEQLGLGRKNAPSELLEIIDGIIADYTVASVKLEPRIRWGRSGVAGLAPALPQLQTWAGAVGRSPPAQTLSWVGGTWTTPTVQVPPGSAPDTFELASWVGLDGRFGTQDVLQAGICSTIVKDPSGAIHIKAEAFMEWGPLPPQPGFFFPVSVGDTIQVLIRMNPGSNAAGTIFFGNVTTKNSHIFPLPQAPGYSIGGSSAEWIVEALPPVKLPYFSPVVFSNCVCGTATLQIPVGQGAPINMTDQMGHVVTAGAIIPPAQVRIGGFPPVVA